MANWKWDCLFFVGFNFNGKLMYKNGVCWPPQQARPFHIGWGRPLWSSRSGRASPNWGKQSMPILGSFCRDSYLQWLVFKLNKSRIASQEVRGKPSLLLWKYKDLWNMDDLADLLRGVGWHGAHTHAHSSFDKWHRDIQKMILQESEPWSATNSESCIIINATQAFTCA